MKRMTIRIRVTDVEAEALSGGVGHIDSMFHGPFDVLDIEDVPPLYGVEITAADGSVNTTWYDLGSEAFQKGKDALSQGLTVRMVTRSLAEVGA